MAFAHLLTPSTLRALAGVLGCAVYILYYHRGEHHLYPQRNVPATISLYFLFALALKHTDGSLTTAAALTQAAILISVYIAAIFTSLTIYRLLLNPLNKFPGFRIARLTGFAHTLHISKNMDRHMILYAAHKKYGRFVRYGPNDISVSDPDVVQVALGAGAVCNKAPWYAFEYPGCSLVSVRDREAHARRRRIWSPAFSDKALRGYEVRVERYNKALLRQIEGLGGKPTNIAKWFECWSFDIMGDLAFGQSFNMLSSPDGHWAITLLKEAQAGGGLSIPNWAARLLFAFPPIARQYFRFQGFCADQIEDRLKIQGKQTNTDITHFLIESYLASTAAPGKRDSEKKVQLARLHFDSKLIVVAGSDTTASTITFLFYHLAREPGLLGRLRDEIRGIAGDSGEIEHRRLQGATLLNACILEALRLHPAVPSGVPRKTPPEGVYVGETYVPGDTVMMVNIYAMAHDEDNFVAADQFIPESFTTRPDLIKQKDAFIPFSTGPAGCIGKNLALMEMRLMTAHLVSIYDIAFAPGEDGAELLKSQDHFTVALNSLYLIFTRREGV
ncbi:cytochrome P450 [Aspergillus carlsbadensis]|nr:cytochrome P450 [Aspergillus carlsbadensis]